MAKERKRSRRRPEDEEEEEDDDVGDHEAVDENNENGSRDDAGEADDGEEEEYRRRRRKKRRRKKKIRIMSLSGQTDGERRVLRRRQRDLKDEIVMGAARGGDDGREGGGGGGGGVDDPTSGELGRLCEQNNELWDDVRYTREAVLDSENVDLLANKAARQAEKMVQVPRYDPIRLAQALVKKGTVRSGSSSQFNWHGLGFQVGVCFNAVPSHASFLYGPLDAEYTPKMRKKPERRRGRTQEEEEESENEEEEKPEDITGKHRDRDGNELSAVQKHIHVIKKTLRRKAVAQQQAAITQAEEYETQISQEIDDEDEVRERKRKFIKERSQVDAVRCLFNPRSFTQTVENIFHFSFAVKDSKAGIRTRGAEEAERFGVEPGPVIRPTEENEIGTPRQAVLSLNMKDWRDMCAAFNVEASDVPHRVDGRVARTVKKERKSN